MGCWLQWGHVVSLSASAAARHGSPPLLQAGVSLTAYRLVSATGWCLLQAGVCYRLVSASLLTGWCLLQAGVCLTAYRLVSATGLPLLQAGVCLTAYRLALRSCLTTRACRPGPT